MNLSVGFKIGFLKAATHTGFTTQQAESLYKTAAPAYGIGLGKKFLTQLLPMAITGGGAAYGAHELGVDPTMTAATGIAAGALSNPRHWQNAWNVAKMQAVPSSYMTDEALKAVGKKALMVGGIGVAEQAPEFLHQSNRTMKNMGDFWDPGYQIDPMTHEVTTPGAGIQLANSTKQLARSGQNVANSIGNTSKSFIAPSEQLTRILKGVADIPGNIRQGWNGLPTAAKWGVGAGAGGLGLLGLSRMFHRDEEKQKQPVVEY